MGLSPLSVENFSASSHKSSDSIMFDRSCKKVKDSTDLNAVNKTKWKYLLF